jgi:hypothetical protein
MSLSTEAVIALVTLLFMCLCIPGLWSFIRRRRLLQQASTFFFVFFASFSSKLSLNSKP